MTQEFTPSFIFTNENFQPLASVEVQLYNLLTLETLGSTQTDNLGMANFRIDLDPTLLWWARPRITRRGTLGQVHVNLVQNDVEPVAASLRFATQPSNVVVDKGIRPAVTVFIIDQNGNLLGGDSSSFVTLVLGENPGPATPLAGVIAQADNGIVVFYDITLDAVGEGYTLIASTTDFDSTNSPESASFDVLDAVLDLSTWLVFTTDPQQIVPSVESNDITVQLQDSSGAPKPSDGGTDIEMTSTSATGVFNPVSPMTIADGDTDATFTYTDTVGGNPVISVKIV